MIGFLIIVGIVLWAAVVVCLAGICIIAMLDSLGEPFAVELSSC